MSLLYPKISVRQLPAMLGYAFFGALVASLYGVVHDQITYSISPEYFTRLKFARFHYSDFGLPPRIFVAEIGFLATWWVGFIAGWFGARITVPAFSPAMALHYSVRAFAIVFASAVAASMVGFVLGLQRGTGADFSAWEDLASERGVVDLPSFVRVAYIHNAGHLGGFIGLIIAIIYLQRLRRLAAWDMEQGA